MGVRRKLTQEEKKKRGCIYCADCVEEKRCIHTECPYHELDDFRSYKEYMDSLEKLPIPNF